MIEQLETVIRQGYSLMSLSSMGIPAVPIPILSRCCPSRYHRHETDRQLIMDTETTGLDALKGDRIIEVGIVRWSGANLLVKNCTSISTLSAVWMMRLFAFMASLRRFYRQANLRSSRAVLYDFMDGAEIIAQCLVRYEFLNMEFAKSVWTTLPSAYKWPTRWLWQNSNILDKKHPRCISTSPKCG